VTKFNKLPEVTSTLLSHHFYSFPLATLLIETQKMTTENKDIGSIFGSTLSSRLSDSKFLFFCYERTNGVFEKLYVKSTNLDENFEASQDSEEISVLISLDEHNFCTSSCKDKNFISRGIINCLESLNRLTLLLASAHSYSNEVYTHINTTCLKYIQNGASIVKFSKSFKTQILGGMLYISTEPAF